MLNNLLKKRFCQLVTERLKTRPDSPTKHSSYSASEEEIEKLKVNAAKLGKTPNRIIGVLIEIFNTCFDA